MSDWTDGYVAEIGYTFGYHGELNPVRIAMPFLNAALVPPRIATACELGFGQGVSVNIHAAASSVSWYGTDFNPAHAAFAQSLAQAAGSGAQLFDQSFAEFCLRADLPDFDYIALHGIWSWVSAENRRVIIDFIRRKLKVGGLLFISYNCQPGFAAMVPLRHLLTEHAGMMAAPSLGIVARIDGAVDFAERLLALNPGFAVANPTIAERLNLIKRYDRHYLAHEYFNRDWTAMLFRELAENLAPAKLNYACSAHYLDHIDALNMTEAQHAFLGEIPDPMFRQSVVDFIVNQQFRRDYWVKGVRRLLPLEQTEALRPLRVLLTSPRSAVANTVQGALGERELNLDVYDPILDALGDHQPKTLGELETAVGGDELTLGGIFEAIMVLAGKGDLALVQDDAAQAAARVHTDKLNRWMFDKARSSEELGTLASPVTGGGIPVSRFHQLFLLARTQDRTSPDEMARFAWDLLAVQGHQVLKDGKPVETPEESLAALAAAAHEFIDTRLPVLQSLQIA
ncbi:MAG TPA: class I SAM-dependent methyltransferase [Stellaceae bacterium]|nr:class I SAM-dependent methyltransferase [Stellaceae bacterium]